MSFSFNPSFWYICRVCRQTFPDADKLKQHKLENHLRDCQRIKFIVFEESFVSEDWTPQDVELSSNFTKTSKSFMNPYVSLKRLTSTDLDSAVRNNNQEIRHKINNALNFDQNDVSQDEEMSEIKTEHQSEQIVIPPQSIEYFVEKSLTLFDPLELHSNGTESESEYDTEPTIDFNRSSNNSCDQIEELNLEFINPNSEIFIIPEAQNLFSESDHEQQQATTSNYIERIELSSSQCFHSSSITNLTVENVDEFHHQNPQEEQVRSRVIHHQVSSPKSKPFMCPSCYACFSKRYALNKHMEVHSDHRPFKCPNCPASFKRKYNLQLHLISAHGENTPHKCLVCNKFFPNNKILIFHGRTHTGDRPFKCHVPDCNITCRSLGLLNAHVKKMHFKELGLPQVLCHICGKSFGVNGERNIHLRKVHKLSNEFELRK